MRNKLELWVPSIALVVLGVPLVSLAANLTTPYTFTSGTAILSADVNTNFSAVQTAVNTKQDLVTGTCTVGSFITSINPAGTVGCATVSYGLDLEGSSDSPGLTVDEDGGYGPALVATSLNGHGLEGITYSPQNYAYGVWGRSALVDNGAGGYSSGVYGENDSNQNEGFGVWGSHAGSGYGVYGTSNQGYGVYGTGNQGGVFGISGSEANGGIVASGADYLGVGLSIQLGSFQVPSANTANYTTAFIHHATAGTLTGTNNYRTIMVNSLLSNDPNLLLIITPNYNAGGVTDAHPVAVYYDSSQGSWEIYNVDGAAIPANSAFNVLIIKS